MLQPAKTAMTEEWLSLACVACCSISNVADKTLHIAGLSYTAEQGVRSNI